MKVKFNTSIVIAESGMSYPANNEIEIDEKLGKQFVKDGVAQEIIDETIEEKPKKRGRKPKEDETAE